MTRQNSRTGHEQAAPQGPTELGKGSWWGAVKRTVREFQADDLSDWAAALTYYAVLSIFPAILALISILGLLGQSAIQPLINNVSGLASGPVRDILTGALQNLQNNQTGGGFFAVVGIVVALWLASRYVAAFMRAANTVYEMPEGRPIWKKLPIRFAITAVLLILLAISAVAVVFTGALADRAAQLLGIGETAVLVWDIAKWPVLVLIVAFMLAILYWAAPNVRQPGFRWVTPGSVLAVVLWIIASAAFALYVANFGSYNATYGAMAGLIIFLIWLWISNLAVLLGLEFDAELARARALHAGQSADKEPYAQPRDASRFEQNR